MDRLDAFSKGMSTWSKWVDTNIDPAKTKVFFQGISPIHYVFSLNDTNPLFIVPNYQVEEHVAQARSQEYLQERWLFVGILLNGSQWGQPDAKSCSGQTKPLSGSTYPGGPLPPEGVVKSVLSKMSKLRVTTLFYRSVEKNEIGRLQELEGEYNDYNETRVGIKKASCNIYKGSWVFDNTYPLYNSSGCPYMGPHFDCQKNGRPDKLYLQYRFDGNDFLKRMKGKKIMFVGDSLSLNNWQSLLCLLHAAVPGASTTFTQFKLYFKDYDVTVAFIPNMFLVDLVNNTDGVALVLDSIQRGKEWLGMDVLIFNSWHWWMRAGQGQPWNYIQIGNQKFKDMDRLDAFSKGMSTWAKWVDTNIDPAKTKVFFQGISPTHTE
ncbi:hypothetical protein QJS10_CPB20g01981 [Acorus calamus]|uniref:Trichome birefringence-like C-terminal domain-containing protein n=1 Tax=Acorus calamus TaxID=4465 RepID=A0AAV9CAP1_ACOCL|nr:hypothetical protein QJS10_CPB20g01981 [Acorus calamus]